MRVNKIIATAAIAAGFAIQSWMLREIVDIKVHMAAIEMRLNFPVRTATNNQATP
jgi:hypothetical protein